MKVTVKVRTRHNRLQLRYVYPPGKREEISLGLSDNLVNRRIAEGKAAEIEYDIANGYYDLTVEKYKAYNPSYKFKSITRNSKEPKRELSIEELWEKYKEFRKKQVAQSTYLVDYQKISKRIGKIPVKNLNDEIAIRDWLLLNYSSETCRRTIQQLSACYKWACRSNLIAKNPFEKIANEIKPTKNTRGKSNKSFTEQEVAAIIKAFETNRYCSPKSIFKHSYYLDYVIWMFYTGMRPEEAVILKYKDINENYIHINKAFRTDCKVLKDTKNHKSRKLLLNFKLQEVVTRRKSIKHSLEDLFFSSPNGKIINYNNFCQRVWKKVIYGLVQDGEVREYLPAYNTKHTFITLCLEKQYDFKKIEGFVGVSSEVIHANYAGILQEVPPPTYS